MDIRKYNKLKFLKGIDLRIALPIFKYYIDIKKPRGYNKEFGGFIEDMMAVLFNLERPGFVEGADFGELGECKSVSARRLKKPVKLNNKQRETFIAMGVDPEDCLVNLRDLGNPPVSSLGTTTDFFKTNLWKKLKIIVFIYHVDGIIVDVRLFDGEKHQDILKRDFDLIIQGKDKETQILTLKKTTKSIQIKKNMDIFLSESITEDVDNNITNQTDYIDYLFKENLIDYRNNPYRNRNLTLKDVLDYLNKKGYSNLYPEDKEIVRQINKFTTEWIEVDDLEKNAKKMDFAKDDELTF